MNEALLTDEPRATSPATEEIPLNRREAAEYLTSKGFRISYATLKKMCSPAIDTGPKSCGRFGKDCMYMPSDLLAWAKARMSASRRSGA